MLALRCLPAGTGTAGLGGVGGCPGPPLGSPPPRIPPPPPVPGRAAPPHRHLLGIPRHGDTGGGLFGRGKKSLIPLRLAPSNLGVRGFFLFFMFWPTPPSPNPPAPGARPCLFLPDPAGKPKTKEKQPCRSPWPRFLGRRCRPRVRWASPALLWTPWQVLQLVRGLCWVGFAQPFCGPSVLGVPRCRGPVL